MTISALLQTAIRALRANAFRSFLTSLGVVVGVSSVVVVTSVSEGARKEISAAINSLGADRLDVMSGSRDGVANSKMIFGGLYLLTEKDVELIRNKIHEIDGASGMLKGSAQVIAGKFSMQTSWIGVQQEGIAVNRYHLHDGRNFRASEIDGAAKVVLLGETVAMKLFGRNNPIGKRVRIANSPFVVIGTLNGKGAGAFGQDLDSVVVVPLRTARTRLMGDFPIPPKAIQQIAVSVMSVDHIPVIRQKIERVMRQSHGIRVGTNDDFFVSGVKETVETRSRANRMMSFLLLIVSVVCLLVGGIGIMNIMLVSVTERSGEIGLRMAMGATPWDVRLQFLTEASVISVSGGLLGLLFGVVGSWLVAKYLFVAVATNFVVIAIATVVSLSVGLIFGYLPSYRASNMDPVLALKRL